MIPTSNHNSLRPFQRLPFVVYLLIPTSNHNLLHYHLQGQELYIFWFLHQTTTYDNSKMLWQRCISFDSYIKPQLCRPSARQTSVVYLLIPTSNHNRRVVYYMTFSLYIFWFLHQTTTDMQNSLLQAQLYIFWFLHQTTTPILNEAICRGLYIFWFLHQTTTYHPKHTNIVSCISFDSYIKPQQKRHEYQYQFVVYLLIPTSNHNTLS